MTRHFRVDPEVIEVDLAEALAYYADIDSSLPDRLSAEFAVGLRRIAAHPTLHAEVHPGVRRVLLGKFPYLLAFIVDHTSVHVVSLLHVHRDPAALAQAVQERRR